MIFRHFVNYPVDEAPLNEAIDLLMCSRFPYLPIIVVGKAVIYLNARITCNQPG
jgi:hypothetical protein